MRYRFTAAVLAGILIFAATPSAAELHGGAAIDTRAAGVPIAPELFGQFSEQLGEGITNGVWVGENSPIPNIGRLGRGSTRATAPGPATTAAGCTG